MVDLPIGCDINDDEKSATSGAVTLGTDGNSTPIPTKCHLL